MSQISPRVNFGRSSSELALIVVGVLIALWAESAWQDRRDALREGELLKDILFELRRNLEIAEGDFATNQETIAAINTWSEIMLAQDETRFDLLENLFVTGQQGARFDPVIGVLQSAVATGDIALIKNNDIRFALSNWLGLADEATRTEIAVSQMLGDHLPVVLSIEPGRETSINEKTAINSFLIFTELRNKPLVNVIERLRELIAEVEDYSEE